MVAQEEIVEDRSNEHKKYTLNTTINTRTSTKIIQLTKRSMCLYFILSAFIAFYLGRVFTKNIACIINFDNVNCMNSTCVHDDDDDTFKTCNENVTVAKGTISKQSQSQHLVIISSISTETILEEGFLQEIMMKIMTYNYTRNNNNHSNFIHYEHCDKYNYTTTHSSHLSKEDPQQDQKDKEERVGIACIGITSDLHITITTSNTSIITWNINFNTRMMKMSLNELKIIFAMIQDFFTNNHTTSASNNNECNDYHHHHLETKKELKPSIYWSWFESDRISVEQHTKITTINNSYYLNTGTDTDTDRSNNDDSPKPNNMIMIENKKKDISYYEGFVHPIMFTSPYPQKVAIIITNNYNSHDEDNITTRPSYNSNINNILPQVLRHNTVEYVTIIVDDDDDNTNHYNVDDIMKSLSCYVNNERVEVIVDTIENWVGNNTNRLNDDNKERLFDVILVSYTYTYSISARNDVLSKRYNDESFLQILHDSLYNDGMIVFELGIVPKISLFHERQEKVKIDDDDNGWSEFLIEIQANGYESIHVYSEWKNSVKGEIVKDSSIRLYLFYMTFYLKCMFSLWNNFFFLIKSSICICNWYEKRL